MNINLHEHFTGAELVVVVICELAWWGFLIFFGRKWWKSRHKKKKPLPDLPYPTAVYQAMRDDER